jgi:hypothetical protein
MQSRRGSASAVLTWLASFALATSVCGQASAQVGPTPEVIQAKSVLAAVGEHVDVPLSSALGSVPAVGWQLDLELSGGLGSRTA